MNRMIVAAFAALALSCSDGKDTPADTSVDGPDVPTDTTGDSTPPDTTDDSTVTDTADDSTVPDTADDSSVPDTTDDTAVEPGCLTDEDCDNGLFCDGEERCLEGSCSPGTEVVCDDSLHCTRDACDETADACDYAHDDTICDDSDACTIDTCDSTSDACVNTLIDGDGDTYPPETCGGDDCDDTDPAIHPGATEICGDGVDQDCDGSDGDVGTCSCPIAASPGSSYPDDTTGAANDHDGSCVTGTGPEHVYELSVATRAFYHLDTDVSVFDTVLYIRESPCDTGTELLCDDDGGAGTSGLSSALNLILDPGTYYVFVDGYDSGEYGTYTLDVEVRTVTVVSGNDTCTTAYVVAADGTYAGDNTTLTDTADGSCGSTGGADAWFAFTLTASSTVTLATNGSSYDTVLYVLDGSCTGTEVDCDDDGGVSVDSLLTLTLAAGTYYVALDAYDSFESGTYMLEVTGL